MIISGTARRRCSPRSMCSTARSSASAWRAIGIRNSIHPLPQINRETPAAADLHLIVDKHATHKHPKVCAWLERPKRFHLHFTPTSASWLNAVEGFFAKLTRQRLQRGVFKGIVDLQAAINRFLAETN